MPIYEYICNECLLKFELRRPIGKADIEIICKKCESHNVRRLLSICNSPNHQKKSQSSNSGCGSCNGGSCNGCHY